MLRITRYALLPVTCVFVLQMIHVVSFLNDNTLVSGQAKITGLNGQYTINSICRKRQSRCNRKGLFLSDGGGDGDGRGGNDQSMPTSTPSTPYATDFAFQELRATIHAMKANRIASRDLPFNKRTELATYARQIVQERPSPIPRSDIASLLSGTKWRLVFSTEAATLGDLPRDATVLLHFLDHQWLDYVLEFSQKTFGLKNLRAKSQWNFDRNNGIMTFVYDQITTDMFGFTDMSVGFFGMLKGRANYVETSYFDGQFWIERAFSQTDEEYINVYERQEW